MVQRHLRHSRTIKIKPDNVQSIVHQAAHEGAAKPACSPGTFPVFDRSDRTGATQGRAGARAGTAGRRACGRAALQRR